MKSFVKVKAEGITDDATGEVSKLEFFINKEAILAFYKAGKTNYQVVLKPEDKELIEAQAGVRFTNPVINKSELK
jgi:hypothetical protein